MELSNSHVAAVKNCQATKPSDNDKHMQQLEDELRKYMSVEQSVSAIVPKHSLGNLLMDAQPAKHSLRSEAAMWKGQFARNLHKQGNNNLKVALAVS